ncbi:MAG TPA: hypothetical protein VIH71_01565 [Solirubrobacteraceae bacterium]
MVVPAAVVAYLRDILYLVLGDEASQITSLTARLHRERHGEWFAEYVARLKQVCVILDVIGWSETRGAEDAELDEFAHGELVLAVLREKLEAAHYLAESDPDPHGSQHRGALRCAYAIEAFLRDCE